MKIQVQIVATLCRLNVEHWLSHIQENIRCDELNSARWVQFYFSMTLAREGYNLEFWNNVAKIIFFSKILKKNLCASTFLEYISFKQSNLFQILLGIEAQMSDQK